MREGGGKAARDCDFVGGGRVDLPKDDANLPAARDRRVIRLKRTRMKKSIPMPF